MLAAQQSNNYSTNLHSSTGLSGLSHDDAGKGAPERNHVADRLPGGRRARRVVCVAAQCNQFTPLQAEPSEKLGAVPAAAALSDQDSQKPGSRPPSVAAPGAAAC